MIGMIRRILGVSGKYKGRIYGAMGFSFLKGLLMKVPIILTYFIVTTYIDGTLTKKTALYGAIALVASIIVQAAFQYLADRLQSGAGYLIFADMRMKLGEHLRRLPMGYFTEGNIGKISSVLSTDMVFIEENCMMVLADMMNYLFSQAIMIVFMFVFDWRMGAACLLAAVISVLSMFTMMGGKNAKLMQEYQAAQDTMSKAGTEYVRGIPVVKVFQQTVYSFKAFKQAIEDYSEKAEKYTDGVCRMPQSVNLTFTEGAFVFLIPVALFLAPSALNSGNFAGFVTNFAFYAVFSAIISTALAKIMFAASGSMLAQTALKRIDTVMNAPVLEITENPKTPNGNKVEFNDVSFTYEGADLPALSHVSFVAKSGQTVALVDPSGGGKTTAASLIPRFWDVSEGAVKVGGIDVREVDPHVLMDHIAFVFQNNRLFKTSIIENVRAARPGASREEVQKALEAAQCMDIIDKLPNGMDTVIGSEGTYLSGGEQQRIALARAILKDAPIVVLDEATAFADPENEVLIQKAFATLTRGKTVIMIAHRLSTVTGADKIIVLDGGQVAEEGTHEELIEKSGLYARMWNEYNQAAKWKIQNETEVR